MPVVPFVKMHGLGNDYVFVDCFRGLPAALGAGLGGKAAVDVVEERLRHLARAASDRHRGVGSDGLILVLAGEQCPFRMRIFNADGSEAEMCGNGVRCFALYVYGRGYAPLPEVEVETGAGLIRTRVLEVWRKEGDIAGGSVRVDMGPPRSFRPRLVEVGGRRFSGYEVSMGNPHFVLLEGWEEADFPAFGPILEKHPAFPRGTNVAFVRRHGEDHLEVLVWERGSGATQACGTGACASLVAAARAGSVGRRSRVSLPGGDLHIEWAGDDRVYMTGPAEEVCRGEFLWSGKEITA